MARWLCVWSPNWAIGAWISRHPAASRGEAFALAAVERGVRRLVAVDAGAAARGLFVGQKAADAAALAPELILAEAEPVADARALAALADACVVFSPAVALDPPDGLFLDVTGGAHLWGGEAAMMDDLAGRLAASGLVCRAAVAATPGAAWAMARFGRDRAVVPPGETAARLAPLPVAALRLEPGEAARIGRLGVRTIGALAALPRAAAGRRFGPAVMRRLDQALGAAEEALVFRRPPEPWRVRAAFAEPVSAPEDLARVAGDLAGRLCWRLEAAGRGARRFELAFHRLDGAVERVRVGLALPGREAAAVTRLLLPRLEGVDPGFGVEAAMLSAAGVETLAARQARLAAAGFPAGRESDPDEAREALAPLVDRLANRLGARAVWRAEAFASHAPERACRRVAPLSPATGEGWDPERPRPLRLFHRPEPIEAVADTPDAPPALFRWRGRAHRVRRAEGPERLTEEWWRRPFDRADPLAARDYYRVEDETGARFWLFRAGLYGGPAPPRWWLHGLFG